MNNVLASLNTPKISRKQSVGEPGSRQYLETILVQLIDSEEAGQGGEAMSPGPLVIKDRYHRLRRYKSVFSGKNLLEKLVENQITTNVDGAGAMAESMVKQKIITRVLNAPISKHRNSSSKPTHLNGSPNKLVGWSDKDLFRLGDDVGVNLKKVVRSMLTLKARVKHLEGSLFDLRETLLELEEDMHYERGIFSNFIRAELKSQIFLVAILFGLASYYTSKDGISGAFEKTHLKQLFVFSFCAVIYLIVW